VLRSLDLRPGDEVLTTDHEYNAMLNAQHEAAARWGAKVVVAQVPFPLGDPDDVVDALLASVTGRTRLALVSHVTSPTAVVFPIERIVRELAGRGIDTIVDAAHAPGMVPVDVDGLGAAYWAANGHKWLCAPKGSAVLWVREDRRGQVRPLVISHGANDPRVLQGTRTRFRLEFDWPGTVDPTPMLAMGDAVGLVAAIEPGGWPAIMAANHALALEGRDAIAGALAIDPPVPDDMLGSMAALPLPGEASDERAAAVHRRLRVDHGIVVPVTAWPVRAARAPGHGPSALLLRISAQRYNEPADYERLAAALPGVLAAEA
jgi:isopenicillin-N epimerase